MWICDEFIDFFIIKGKQWSRENILEWLFKDYKVKMSTVYRANGRIEWCIKVFKLVITVIAVKRVALQNTGENGLHTVIRLNRCGVLLVYHRWKAEKMWRFRQSKQLVCIYCCLSEHLSQLAGADPAYLKILQCLIFIESKMTIFIQKSSKCSL